jgi:hypothetical protein
MNPIALDEVPAPGEPLQPKIHEDNQRILDEEIAARLKRAQAKLPLRERWRLQRRYNQLHRLLNKAHYNQLIQERFELHQLCSLLQHQILLGDPETTADLKVQLKAAAQRGKKINAALDLLKPQAEEFRTVANRLRAHYEVIAWEKEDAQNTAAFKREAATWEHLIRAVFRQSPRLHHKFINQKGKTIIKAPDIERAIFKEDRVLYQVRLTRQTIFQRVIGRWSSALPYAVDVPNLTCEETLQNLSAACNRIVTVERSKIGTNLFYVISRLDAPDGIPKRLLYSKAMEWYPYDMHRKTPWAAGGTFDRKVKWFNFEDNPHVLIAGSSGGGKSTHINGMIACIATANSPAEVRMVMVDLKGGVELGHWRKLKHLMGNIVKTSSGILGALESVREVMDNRLEVFDAIGAKNLASYNEKSAEPMPRIIVFIDEMATLIGLGELTTAIHNELRVLTSQGRAAGIHMVLATQHPSIDVVPGWIKTNMGIRIASKMPSHSASQVILDTINAALLPGGIPGRMVFSIGRDEVVAQSPFISDGEIAEVVRLSHLHTDVIEYDFSQPVEVKEKFSRYDVIEMALTKFNCKLSVSRIHEEVGNAVISERKLKHIIEDITEPGVGGEVEHNGSTYRLRKDRKTWVLDLIGQIGQSDNDLTDGDSEEFRPIERPTEERPIELEAIAS